MMGLCWIFSLIKSNVYRGRVSFAGGNGRRSAAISAGKRNATPVKD